MENGLKNQKAIEAIASWGNKYPAFKWCTDKNKNGSGGWYSPAPAEMAELFAIRIEDGEGNISLSEYLNRVDGTRFSETDDKGSPYWSSMEDRSSDGKFAASAYFTKNNWVTLKTSPTK